MATQFVDKIHTRSQTDLNGSPCTVLSYDKEASRWLVRLDMEAEDNEILVSSSNLLPLWTQAELVDAAECGRAAANVVPVADGDGSADGHSRAPAERADEAWEEPRPAEAPGGPRGVAVQVGPGVCQFSYWPSGILGLTTHMGACPASGLQNDHMDVDRADDSEQEDAAIKKALMDAKK
eukprot:Skav201493  [mRNA]  locus=scaffold1996:31978:35921:- [translate_table: standard]